MFSSPSVPQCEPEIFMYPNEVPSLAHTFVLSPHFPWAAHPADTLPPHYTQLYSWPMRAQASPCTANFTYNLLLSWRWNQHPKFWAGSNLSLFIRCLRKSYMLKQATLPFLSHMHYDFSPGLPFSECEHNSGLNQRLHHDIQYVIYTLLCSRVSFHIKQFALFKV